MLPTRKCFEAEQHEAPLADNVTPLCHLCCYHQKRTSHEMTVCGELTSHFSEQVFLLSSLLLISYTVPQWEGLKCKERMQV